MDNRLPTKLEWESAGFDVPKELCGLEEARTECLEIVQTLQQGMEDGTLSNNAAQMLLTVLHVHLLALGFKRIEPKHNKS
jgi:hypothetical protein